MSPPLLSLQSIVKSFPGTLALDHVDFICQHGEIHGLVGENGAGKSTLMKILAGIHRPDHGKIFLNGLEQHFQNHSDARKSGIGVVYQELSLLPEISVAENISMGIWPRKRCGIIDRKAMIRRANTALQEVGIDVEAHVLVKSLPMPLRQMVEIAKVLTQKPKVIVFDEPTSALSKDEVDRLFTIICDLKSKGNGIIFISHRLEEVLHLADRITVMKDGQKVLTEQVSSFDKNRLISLMVGRDVSKIFPEKSNSSDRTHLIFEYHARLQFSGKHVHFSVAHGEVLGIGGLQGQGQLEMLQSIFGLGGCEDLTILVHGRETELRNPVQAIRAGIALVPDNRGEEGIFPALSARDNLTASTLKRRQQYGFIRKRDEKNAIERITQQLSLKLTSTSQTAESLSGGNMQKLVLGKWLLAEPQVMVMLEPTKGVDVAVKQQIYQLMRELASCGVAVIVYTSDLIELIGVSDRVLVMNHGCITAELSGEELTEENIMQAAVSSDDILETEV
ncbi:sugar ABC transporter ATP-binding protein [candidate division KSB3 bacterium]|uniref:Sugar ABC transporter ATP-binding protein n=1 Tax=candidate division KSB3 bacterium TaxID=2044937 RepID=A0A2G6E788_9BACT|nr:MAG: sugar ABC transporter ATP-binding protein [candidate division KSB3 bacterium]PIE30212.1 MAG: sugar ABC transporter ATP-binding protein [candidate division KSB3 bacterium]